MIEWTDPDVTLRLWVIFQSPLDHPGKWVLRPQVVRRIGDDVTYPQAQGRVGIRHGECGMTSWNPNDVYHGYCGFCHRFLHDGRVYPEEPVAIVDTLEEARAAVPAGLYNIGRQLGDVPSLYEVWL